MGKKAVLVDVSKCIGCRGCQVACKQWNGLPMEKTVNTGSYQNPPDLSAITYTLVRFKENPAAGKMVWTFFKDQCRHCVEPACVSACLVGALQKTPEGPVIYDSDRCMGCRYCMMSCPYGIPRYTWEDPVPYIRKCDMCYDRVKEGRQPACVEACPEKATIFGQRDALIKEAHDRIGNNPGRYIDKVFGRKRGQLRGYPGHEEIELALVKLYRATAEQRYLKLAAFFVNERGQRPHYYDKESKARGEEPGRRRGNYDDIQAHLLSQGQVAGGKRQGEQIVHRLGRRRSTAVPVGEFDQLCTYGAKDRSRGNVVLSSTGLQAATRIVGVLHHRTPFLASISLALSNMA